MFTRLFIATILFLSIPIFGFGQEDRVYWNYDITDGLPTNNLYHILIDHSDRIWFGSDYGVTCYDGNHFKTYTVEDGLIDNTVIRCYEDSLNRIWFQHLNSLPTYFEDGQVHQLKNIDKRLQIHQLSHLLEIRKGNFMVPAMLSNVHGLLHIAPDFSSSFRPYGKTGFFSGYVANDTIHVGTANAKSILFIKNFVQSELGINEKTNVKSIHYDFNELMVADGFDLDIGALFRSAKYFEESDKALGTKHGLKKVYHIIIKNNIKYFATSNGIYEFIRKNEHWILKNHFLKDEIFVSVDLDSKGNIWATSLSNGLFKIPRLSYEKYQLNKNQRCIFSVIIDNEIYFSGENIPLTKLKNKTTSEIVSNPFNQYFDFYSQGYSKQNEYQIHYNSKGWSIYNSITKKEESVQYDMGRHFNSIVPSKQRQGLFILFGEFNLGFLDINKKPFVTQTLSKYFPRVRHIAEIGSTLFIGTQKGLLQYTNDIPEPKEILSKTIGTSRINGLISFDKDLFIGTANKGLYLYNEESKKIRRWNLNSISNEVKGVYPGINNSFWLHTFIGLQEFTKENRKWKETQRIDLKTDIKVNDIVNIHQINDTLVIVTNNTIYYIPIQKKFKLHQLKFSINSLKINNKFHNLTKSIALKSKENNISFSLTAINHSAHPTKLYYRINNGLWVLNRSLDFSFSSLSPGKYTIDFKATSPFYRTAYILGQKIKIERLWFQSFWFIGLLFFFSLIIVAYIVRWRITKVQNRKQRSLSNELLALQSQMNPHFTFNSLNSIQSYLSTNDKRSAQLYLADFALLMRQILEQAKLSLISLEQEVTFLTQYLNLEKRRLDGEFSFQISLDNNIDKEKTKIPSLMLQPFVENAIWHGVAALDYPGEIKITFEKQDNRFVCQISDNGQGILSSTEKNRSRRHHKSTGINNCKERMKLFEEIYQKKIEFSVSSDNQKHKGTIVTITFPIIEKKNEV